MALTIISELGLHNIYLLRNNKTNHQNTITSTMGAKIKWITHEISKTLKLNEIKCYLFVLAWYMHTTKWLKFELFQGYSKLRFHSLPCALHILENMKSVLNQPMQKSFPGAPWDQFVRTQDYTFRNSLAPSPGLNWWSKHRLLLPGTCQVCSHSQKHSQTYRVWSFIYFSPRGSLKMWS